ncbi:nuclear transport factor 2 family protein [Niabella sp. CC-SYL272]|uniref:nuclear transport factor 2 family protein n=1 Tax=Niabella agricola TaxID=2891571 RepID=UPI001F21BF0B|nr:nuclear transport factor 2 family protein [Niabella agricola]MCF3107569.1 nuclear transport factor 2 family protein [Niabella agricola]
MEKQLLELEKKYWKAMEDHDFKTVESLTRFPCIVAGRTGARTMDAATFQQMFESGAGRQLKLGDISGAESQMINEDTAIIAYQVGFEYVTGDDRSSFRCVCASTWVKENGNWVCALHTETDLNEQPTEA